MKTKHLAIVIPAYKSQFLRPTLNSLVNQTNYLFAVYIGDDNGSKEIPSIVESFKGSLEIQYVRFENNLGKSSLVKHWERCMNTLNVSEPWFTILGDDDVLPENFVEEFYNVLSMLQSNKINVVRYASEVIDQDSEKISNVFTHPILEANGEFLLRKLNGQTRSSLSEYIFNRSLFVESNGIPEFPLAWFSDDATVIKYSFQSGIYSINSSIVQIRNSGSNISSDPNCASQKLLAILQYYDWILKNKCIIKPLDLGKFEAAYTYYLQKHTFYEKLSFNDRYRIFLKLLSINKSEGLFYFFKFIGNKVYYKIQYEKEKLLYRWKYLLSI